MAAKAECVIQASWSSNRMQEQHAFFVIKNQKGKPELLPFEGGTKLLHGAATIAGYDMAVKDGVETECWDLAFDAKITQGFVIGLDDIIRANASGTLTQTFRHVGMQMVQMQTQDGQKLGKLPMNALVKISDEQIVAAANRVLKNVSPAEIARRLAA